MCTISGVVLTRIRCFTEELLDRLVKKHCIRELEVIWYLQPYHCVPVIHAANNDLRTLCERHWGIYNVLQ